MESRRLEFYENSETSKEAHTDAYRQFASWQFFCVERWLNRLDECMTGLPIRHLISGGDSQIGLLSYSQISLLFSLRAYSVP